MLSAGAERLERAGADFFLMACNTVHCVSDAIEARVGIPLLHISDAAGRALQSSGVERVGLLGTRHTMQGQFYSDHLRRRYSIETLVPDDAAQAKVHGLIQGDLVHGIVSPAGRRVLDEIGEALGAKGSQATLLACTELGLLYDEAPLGAGASGGGRPESGLPVVGRPVYDTLPLHALAAVDLALST